ncbi:MAG TPA: bifunctional 4-hydroxy-2-oxoglutarate aldolase/2-dehydro-3-deoxy-phosphogluconate aldolase [Ilumatobacteraceae bacterium]|nr:bifunctional 4-hydroxy-2-oxoglutarate aldolase/2-dehydro-3-deoxy-phosphogluconate aldolase [Ilumatobacteraceae bacterium]
MNAEQSNDAGRTAERVIDVIGRVRVVPVLTVAEPDDAVHLVRALVEGGLPVVEITLRTPSGLEAIRRSRLDVPDAIVGAGSVTSATLAAAAIDAGAAFVVSPGLDDGVIDTATSASVPVLPGVATATELLRAVNAGLDAVKLFPAEQLGGPGLIRAFAAVWPDVRFMPTGGVTAGSAPSYLALPQVLAVGGSWMVNTAAVDAHDWSRVTDDATTAARLGAAVS